jgi:hypothetical protein
MNFNPHGGPRCTVQNFAIEILGKPKSVWNVSVTKVFACDFVAHHPNSQYNAVTHLRSLRRAYKQAGLDEVTLKAHQKKMGEKNANVWYVFMA